MGVLKSDGADGCFVGQHGRFAALGAGAGAVPDAGVAAAAGGEPAGGVVVGEVFYFRLVAAHVELDVGLGNPEVHARVLVAGDEPFAVGRPDEGVDAVGVGEGFLEEKIVGIPELDAAEVRGGNATGGGLGGKGGDGFGGVGERVGDRAVGAEGGEFAAGGGEERGAAPGEMFDPSGAERGGGGVLTGGCVPEFDGAVLAAGRENGGGGGLPGEAVGAVGVTGEFVATGAVGGGEKGNGAGGAGGGEQVAVGCPREVDGVVVEGSGPVLGELHRREAEGGAEWRARRESRAEFFSRLSLARAGRCVFNRASASPHVTSPLNPT